MLFASPMQTKLHPQTVEQFDAYQNSVEHAMEERWNKANASLAVEESPDDLKRVLAGELLVRPSTPTHPIGIYDGLIHDWTGDVFIPNIKVDRVIQVLEDYDHHASIYRDIVRSRLLSRGKDHLTGYWRIEKKTGPLSTAIDVYEDSDYREIGPGKWVCRSHSSRIVEVEDADTAHEKTLPEGQGSGYVWRLSADWTLEARNGGVLAECRNLTLSRTVPSAIAWLVTPIAKDQARDSMTSSLQATRDAASGTHTGR